MKRALLLVSITGIFFLTSCEEKNVDSLVGTWKSARIGSENGWHQDELTFTDTNFSYIRKTDYGTTGGPFTGTYKFDPPTVALQVELIEGETYVQPTYGTVERRSMTVEIMTRDIMWTLKLKKQ